MVKIPTRIEQDNRGLGYGISYKLEIPNIAEDEESKARADTLRVTALTTLTTFGYSLDSAITALELPNNWRTLEQGVKAPVITNDKPEVDEGGEVEESPKACAHHNHLVDGCGG